MKSLNRHALCWLIVVGAVLGFAGSASAHTTIIAPAEAHFPYQQWVDEAKVPTPDVTLEVIETAADHGCPDRVLNYAGCTSPQLGKVWAAPEAFARRGPRQTFWHELGHNVDADLLQPWMRERFMELFGLTGPWLIEGEPEPYGPNERFADVWAECALKPKLPLRAGLGFGPIYQREPMGGRRVHNAICRMLGKL